MDTNNVVGNELCFIHLHLFLGLSILPANESSSSNSEPQDREGVRREEILREMDQFIQTLKEAVEYHADDNTVQALKKAVLRLKSVKNSNTLNSSLFMFGSSVGIKRSGGGMIPVQPSAIQRRQAGLSRGKRPLGKSGRKPNCLPEKKAKRPHNLALNIKENRANAKSH